VSLAAPPEPSRVYRNHHLDSTRWELFEPRDGDVVVTTSYKSGTTWMQQILLMLLHGPEAMPRLTELSPWIDARFLLSKAQLAGTLRSLPGWSTCPPAAGRELFRGGPRSFFFKASNGRWRDLLTESDLGLHGEAKQRVPPPDCARWLERGGAG
jgi:hypothetical protein